MIKPLLDFARRHIILFGTAKFAAGLLIGFALGVYFLPILTDEKGLDTAALAQLEASAELEHGAAGAESAPPKKKTYIFWQLIFCI